VLVEVGGRPADDKWILALSGLGSEVRSAACSSRLAEARDGDVQSEVDAVNPMCLQITQWERSDDGFQFAFAIHPVGLPDLAGGGGKGKLIERYGYWMGDELSFTDG
jgi:hypothetical protein